MGVVLTLPVQSPPRHGEGWRHLTGSLPVLRAGLATLPGGDYPCAEEEEGTVPLSTKWQRLNDSESGTHSEAQSVEPQLFHPSLDREDKEEFKFEAPD